MPIDLGAMWIHGGGPGNALYDLSVKLQIPLSDQENYNAVTTHSSAGPVVGAPGRFAYLVSAPMKSCLSAGPYPSAGQPL